MYQELFEQVSQTFCPIFHIMSIIASSCFLIDLHAVQEGYMREFWL
jgi:hypothetical protein